MNAWRRETEMSEILTWASFPLPRNILDELLSFCMFNTCTTFEEFEEIDSKTR